MGKKQIHDVSLNNEPSAALQRTLNGLPFVLEFLLLMLNRITIDLRTELLKFLDYYENVHNDGNWSFGNVVDKYIESHHDGKPMLCAVCKSDEKVEFFTITDCNLCGKCQDELSDGFERAMTMDRSDYPEL